MKNFKFLFFQIPDKRWFHLLPLLAFLSPNNLTGQNGVKTYLATPATERMTTLDSLRHLYGKNKRLPAAFELPALAALSHYPELANASIRFVVKKSKLP